MNSMSVIKNWKCINPNNKDIWDLLCQTNSSES